MKNIAICGDSWFCADTRYPGRSFGEIMCEKNSWNLLSLAVPGCSNFAIALQVDKAIELQADFVVIGSTTPDRIDLPLVPEHNKKQLLDWNSWFQNQSEVYDKTRNIANVLHRYHSLSGCHDWITDPVMISESINNLVFSDQQHILSSEQVDSLRSYMLYLYDSGIKRQTDSWIISDACRRLQSKSIPYLIFIESLYQWGFANDISWVSEHNLVRPDEFSIWNNVPHNNSPARFHYCIDNGGTVIAQYVESRIKNCYDKR